MIKDINNCRGNVKNKINNTNDSIKYFLNTCFELRIALSALYMVCFLKYSQQAYDVLWLSPILQVGIKTLNKFHKFSELENNGGKT